MKNLNTSYDFYRRSPRPDRSSKLMSRLVVVGVICLGGLFLLRAPSSPMIGPIISHPSPSPLQDPQLTSLIQPLIPTDNGDYAIIVRSLLDDQHNYFYQSSRPFPAASLYKLFVLSAVFRQIDQGTLKFDTTISGKVDDLSDRLGALDSGYEDAKGTISYRVENCLDRVARLSDNFCALMLSDKIGWDQLQAEADLLGAKDTSIKSPITTTPEDISTYFTQLYNGQIVDATASGQIVDLLATNYNKSRIPSLLPDGLKIAHKTGELSRLRHDAGIVYLQSHPYLIIMMSENVKGEDSAIDAMAQISKAVYDYFAGLGTKPGI